MNTFRNLSLQHWLDIVWLVFLSLLFVYFWFERRRFLKAKFWVKTDGRISQYELIMHGHRLWPRIEYIYQVQDQEFVGGSFFLDTSYTSLNRIHARKLAYQVANNYKNNEKIDVYYNPDKPTQAALDVSVPGKLNLILILIGTLIMLHLSIVYFAPAINL